MHIRAHGTVAVIFGNLHDAGSDPVSCIYIFLAFVGQSKNIIWLLLALKGQEFCTKWHCAKLL